jgi:hypothetical protein
MAQLNIANPHASGNVLRPLSRFYAYDSTPTTQILISALRHMRNSGFANQPTTTWVPSASNLISLRTFHARYV